MTNFHSDRFTQEGLVENILLFLTIEKSANTTLTSQHYSIMFECQQCYNHHSHVTSSVRWNTNNTEIQVTTSLPTHFVLATYSSMMSLFLLHCAPFAVYTSRNGTRWGITGLTRKWLYIRKLFHRLLPPHDSMQPMLDIRPSRISEPVPYYSVVLKLSNSLETREHPT